ncbi:MAG: trypsin-like serine protease [Myxococcota bacterium]|nr:trypsin-like serine protease [Myxococcota bacterium]
MAGSTDTGDPAVVYVLVIGQNASVYDATGIVVAPHVVLTAAHVIAGVATVPTASFRVFTDSDRRNHGSNPAYWLSVREAHVDPAFKYGDTTAGHDIGVLILNAPTSIPPLPLNRAAMDQSLIGQTVRFSGYGVTSRTDALLASSQLRREASSTIAGVLPYYFNTTMGGSQSCSGDSGGPALVMSAGLETVAGVVSMNDFACTSTAFARVDVSAAFIDQWIARVDPPSLDGGAQMDAGEGEPDEAAPLLDAAGAEEGHMGAIDSAVTVAANSINDPGARRSGCSVAHSTSRPGSFVAMMIVLSGALLYRRRCLLR